MHRISRAALMQTLGLKSKIPLDFEGRYPDTPVHEHPYGVEPWGKLTIVIVKSPPGNYSKHRVFVECPCGRLIPAGRFRQHRKACKV